MSTELLAALPEEMRAEPSLQTFKDVPSLAKSYVEAQKLIGAKRIALPGEKATEQDWSGFYAAIGRPETSDKYETPETKFEDEALKPDAKALESTKQMFHKLGLTNKQAKGIMEYYFGTVNEAHKAHKSGGENAAQSSIARIRETWGDKFDTNVEIAKSVITKFGGESADEIKKFLDGSGLGNNAPLVMLLHRVGSAMLEDKARGGTGGDLLLGDQARAVQEIDQLKMDKDFQAALGDARNIGHRAALDRWMNLHKVAHPGKSE